MTAIRVEKRCLPWWTYQLGTLTLIAVAAGVLGCRSRGEGDRAATGAPAATGAAQPAPTAPATGGATVSDLVSLRAPDAQALVGRPVELRDAQVQRVIGDRVFTVGSEGSEIFVRLDAPLDRGAAEQKVQVKAGQSVSLGGIVQRPPEAGGTEGWQGLSEADLAALRRQPVYILARRISGAK